MNTVPHQGGPVQCSSGGLVEMLRKLCGPLIWWLGTAVVCCSDLCVMLTSRSQVRRTQFCSLCLIHDRVLVLDPPMLNR